MRHRLITLGATVDTVPEPSELPNLVAAVARCWASIHLADPDLARELLRRLPKMEISTTPPEAPAIAMHAAAPDLLAALKAVLTVWHDATATRHDDAAAEAAARAAIAKAEAG